VLGCSVVSRRPGMATELELASSFSFCAAAVDTYRKSVSGRHGLRRTRQHAAHAETHLRDGGLFAGAAHERRVVIVLRRVVTHSLQGKASNKAPSQIAPCACRRLFFSQHVPRG
jgi:hypothetical protein